jgi:hypothetical protein
MTRPKAETRDPSSSETRAPSSSETREARVNGEAPLLHSVAGQHSFRIKRDIFTSALE